ncbi:MAG: hypothetical protein QOJ19_1108, partial [Acidimicrobiia bacterium]|nr:hypothetical protein [Acidimicrobiia bacterium]
MPRWLRLQSRATDAISLPLPVARLAPIVTADTCCGHTVEFARAHRIDVESTNYAANEVVPQRRFLKYLWPSDYIESRLPGHLAPKASCRARTPHSPTPNSQDFLTW